ncbi:MAG: RidA family protein [Kiritimatiellia bacterium]
MNSQIAQATFLWGTPDEVRARVCADLPSFRLCRPEGAFAPVRQEFLSPRAQFVKKIVRRDKTVARLFEDDDAVYCMAAGVLPADLNAPRGEQAASVFLELESVLADAGMTFADVVRTWLYIDRVCEWYGAFNAARSAFFETRNVFNTFLPASTGIGCGNLDGAALTAGAIAMKPKRAGVRAEIVESPLQAPAMAYRSSFSRAAEIITPDSRELFISGTASIEPNSHEVAFVGDIEKQIACTMRAVYAILESRGYGWKDVSRALVYLKDPSFRAPWRAWLKAQGLPEDFAAETVCDVCRDEWLFEIEADAVMGERKI